MLGVGESRIDRGLVAERDRDPDIAARALLPDFRRRGLRGLLEIDQRRQKFVVHRNELGGVARLRLRFGDDEGDAVADAADAVGEQNRARGRKTGRPAPGVRHEERRNAADLVGRGIRAGEHAKHTRRGFGCSGIDPLDDRMRVRREHRNAVALPRQRQISDELSRPGGEALILDTANRLSDPELAHGSLLGASPDQAQKAPSTINAVPLV